jgi:hypothetical protein
LSPNTGSGTQVIVRRYYKKHEETLLAKAEREMARQV